MNKIQVSLGVLVSLTVSIIRPLDMQPAKRGIKKKGTHLVRCLQGKEPCTKTDFAIFGASLLLLRSSFFAALSLVTHEYVRSHTVDQFADRQKRTGTIPEHVRKYAQWLPGRLPQTLLHKARMRWSTGAKKSRRSAGVKKEKLSKKETKSTHKKKKKRSNIDS